VADILVIDGNPKPNSFCEALATSYLLGASNAGATVQLLRLSHLHFDANLAFGYDERQPLEPDLLDVQIQLAVATHIVVVTPVWWGGLPARLKGLFDRVLLPGFAFRYEKGNALPTRLLSGRTARLIVTMDSPVWYYRLVTGDLITRTLVRAMLGFCGIAVETVDRLGPVIKSSETQRRRWLDDAYRNGLRDARRAIASGRRMDREPASPAAPPPELGDTSRTDTDSRSSPHQSPDPSVEPSHESVRTHS